MERSPSICSLAVCHIRFFQIDYAVGKRIRHICLLIKFRVQSIPGCIAVVIIERPPPTPVVGNEIGEVEMFLGCGFAFDFLHILGLRCFGSGRLCSLTEKILCSAVLVDDTLNQRQNMGVFFHVICTIIPQALNV